MPIPPRPAALRILTWGALLISLGMFLSLALNFLEIGPALMGGEHIDRAIWWRVAAPLVTLAGTLTAITSYGLAREKPWARHYAVALFVLIFAYAAVARALNGIPDRMMWRAFANASLFGGVAIWYFYFKPNVAAYFRALRQS
jgi:hypothetical protein